MLLNSKPALVVLLIFLAVSVWVGILGIKAYFEREIYVAVIENILGDDRGGLPIDVPLSIFISRPYYCGGSSELSKTPPLISLRRANGSAARPIPLESIGGRVPVVSWEDAKRIAKAGYQWTPAERGLIWISRVGFSDFYSEAAVCIAKSDLRHGWGIVFILKRRGLEWEVVLEERHAISI